MSVGTGRGGGRYQEHVPLVLSPAYFSPSQRAKNRLGTRLTCPASQLFSLYNYVLYYKLKPVSTQPKSLSYTSDIIMQIQWNPSITDTVGDQNFVRYSEVSLTQGLPVYFR